MFITITGSNHYLGVDSYMINQELYLVKDINNVYDDEAIKVVNEEDVKYGYVANSVNTVARGTHSAGYIYNLIKDKTKVFIRFVLEDSVIAEIKEKDK